MVNIPVESIDTLKTAVRGKFIAPADSDYDEARKVWNAAIDRRPALIVRCAGTADVIAALAFARDNAMLISIRGGAHNIAGSAVSDDALMIDLSAMKSVRVDPQAKRAYVEPGALLSDFDHEAQAFGLATPLGINSTTGVAGLTLGGGFGWISRKFGVTVDNLVAAEIITADGQWHRVSVESEPELFWALRGGGGNFGVVTLFEFRLHEVGPQVYGGLVVYPLEQADQVLPKYRDFVASSPDEMTVWAVMRLAPPLPFLPEDVHGKPIIALACCFIGPVEDGAKAIEPVRSFGTPYGEHLGPMPFATWQKAFDPLLTPGARNYWKSHNFASLPDETFDVLTKAVLAVPSPHCEVFIGAMGGQTNRVPVDATAYANRDSIYTINIHGRWTDPADDEKCTQWTREMFAALTPYATGSVYVNFLTGDEGDRVKAAYGPNFERLAEVKRRYDPNNVFRSNQNIPPA
ncbi:FAD-binding oxidoreductase [Caballeronia grimmiae]|uniref:FAD-linked oxidase n=1 Tax=Caballeronia grimmiae TaxID=1071679 RepID=A0A069NMS4_9BURK|nr:FAD-binding oxidoreductase [Caballeronia grimmiae]KDR29758.1 FAD-linked oxidase [Caballeronia grimmiae]GGD66160.1 FAD-linked oxidase [Caballeronia grimmiae]